MLTTDDSANVDTATQTTGGNADYNNVAADVNAAMKTIR
jgi:hypothetical protein